MYLTKGIEKYNDLDYFSVLKLELKFKDPILPNHPLANPFLF